MDSTICRAFLSSDRAWDLSQLIKSLKTLHVVFALPVQCLMQLMAATMVVIIFAQLQMHPLPTVIGPLKHIFSHSITNYFP